MYPSAEMIAITIPLMAIIASSVVAITYIYLTSKEKQMLIQRGVETEKIKDLYIRQRDGFIISRIGFLLVGIGMGIGFGQFFADITNQDAMMPFTILVCSGTSLIVGQKYSSAKNVKKGTDTAL